MCCASAARRTWARRSAGFAPPLRARWCVPHAAEAEQAAREERKGGRGGQAREDEKASGAHPARRPGQEQGRHPAHNREKMMNGSPTRAQKVLQRVEGKTESSGEEGRAPGGRSQEATRRGGGPGKRVTSWLCGRFLLGFDPDKTRVNALPDLSLSLSLTHTHTHSLTHPLITHSLDRARARARSHVYTLLPLSPVSAHLLSTMEWTSPLLPDHHHHLQPSVCARALTRQVALGREVVPDARVAVPSISTWIFFSIGV